MKKTFWIILLIIVILSLVAYFYLKKPRGSSEPTAEKIIKQQVEELQQFPSRITEEETSNQVEALQQSNESPTLSEEETRKQVEELQNF